MHFILVSFGTDGDVFPYIGLGSALQARGHRVTLSAPEPYRSRAEALGMEFLPLVTTAEMQRMLGDPDLWHPFRSGFKMARWGVSLIPRQYELLSGLAARRDSVVVTNPGVLASRLVHEKLHTPTASLVLQPGLLPSSTAPPEMPGGTTIPPWFPQPLRSLYWLGVDAVGYALVTYSLNRIRAQLGLRPVRRLFRWWLSPELTIGLFPSWFATPQPDWPPQLRLAGFGRFDGTEAELPEGLRSFCIEGSPPIAFTLGTGMRHAANFFRTAIAASEALGARAIFLTRHSDLIPRRLPVSMRHCVFAPFHRLLPLCRAIVHHGGIGTTAAALDAGCPQLILPLAWDQPDNAARVARLGAGLTLGPRRRSIGHVTRALSRLMTPDITNRCSAITKQARAQDGLQFAANWIEEFAGIGKTS